MYCCIDNQNHWLKTTKVIHLSLESAIWAGFGGEGWSLAIQPVSWDSVCAWCPRVHVCVLEIHFQDSSFSWLGGDAGCFFLPQGSLHGVVGSKVSNDRTCKWPVSKSLDPETLLCHFFHILLAPNSQSPDSRMPAFNSRCAKNVGPCDKTPTPGKISSSDLSNIVLNSLLALNSPSCCPAPEPVLRDTRSHTSSHRLAVPSPGTQ